jgi:hypothetical protein
MKNKYTQIKTLAALAGLALTATSANAASVAAVSVAPGTVGLTSYAMGWSFTTTTTIYVTDLGKFDSNGGGLAANAQVGLYNDTTNALITSITVPTSSTAEAKPRTRGACPKKEHTSSSAARLC